MWIYTGNKSAKFHGNIFSLSVNIAKSFRGATFWLTLYIRSKRRHCGDIERRQDHYATTTTFLLTMMQSTTTTNPGVVPNILEALGGGLGTTTEHGVSDIIIHHSGSRYDHRARRQWHHHSSQCPQPRNVHNVRQIWTSNFPVQLSTWSAQW